MCHISATDTTGICHVIMTAYGRSGYIITEISAVDLYCITHCAIDNGFRGNS